MLPNPLLGGTKSPEFSAYVGVGGIRDKHHYEKKSLFSSKYTHTDTHTQSLALKLTINCTHPSAAQHSSLFLT